MFKTSEDKQARVQDNVAQTTRAEPRQGKREEGEAFGSRSEQTNSQETVARPDAARFVDDATTITEDSWKNIIWREWCRAEDEEYAESLYILVRASVLGVKFVALFALLCTIGGAFLGLFLGKVLADLGIQAGLWSTPYMLPAFLGWGFSVAGAAFGVWSSRMYRTWYYWWQGQPPSAKVESALREACRSYPEVARIWHRPLQRLTLEKVRHRPVVELIRELTNPDWSYRFAARLALATRGGQAAAALHTTAIDRENPLWEVATGLLGTIEHETRNAYAWRVADTVCPHCFTRFAAHPLNMPLGVSFTVYGCRLCKQSLEHYYLPHGVVAVLDSRHSKEHSVKDGLLRVNWLTRKELFDFDRVDIIQATDEEVERFAVQVGNDTDPVRSGRYKSMRCRVGCTLSENTIRVLRRIFGVVAIDS